MTNKDSTTNGIPVQSFSYAHGALDRPVSRNADAFGYNARSEVVLSRRAAEDEEDSYSYDEIGNLQSYSSPTETNAYTANNLNQYTSILRASVPLCEPTYDADGNLLRDGLFRYAYDAENRMIRATSLGQTNGAIRILDAYDHAHRRTKKTIQRMSIPGDGASAPGVPPMPQTGDWTTTETRTYIWDGNDIVLEKVEFADGTTRTCEYFWGPDLSGTEQGAGGVGGLLAVSIDGVFHIPCYDHNGNIVLYASEMGSAAGITLGASVGWTGAGAIGAAGLLAIGADQFTSGVRNLVNRARAQSVSNDSYVQIAYKYVSETFSTAMSGISFFSSPTNDIESLDVENGADHGW